EGCTRCRVNVYERSIERCEAHCDACPSAERSRELAPRCAVAMRCDVGHGEALEEPAVTIALHHGANAPEGGGIGADHEYAAALRVDRDSRCRKRSRRDRTLGTPALPAVESGIECVHVRAAASLSESAQDERRLAAGVALETVGGFDDECHGRWELESRVCAEQIEAFLAKFGSRHHEQSCALGTFLNELRAHDVRHAPRDVIDAHEPRAARSDEEVAVAADHV